MQYLQVKCAELILVQYTESITDHTLPFTKDFVIASGYSVSWKHIEIYYSF